MRVNQQILNLKKNISSHFFKIPHTKILQKKKFIKKKLDIDIINFRTIFWNEFQLKKISQLDDEIMKFE